MTVVTGSIGLTVQTKANITCTDGLSESVLLCASMWDNKGLLPSMVIFKQGENNKP
jgi:hypothetical protein